MQRAILFLARFAARLYYRPTRLGAHDPGGPLLVVANHPNGLIDPVFLAGVVRRPVRFLGKAPLFELPVLGILVRGFGTLPIHRPGEGPTADNVGTFAAVHRALAAGEVVCVFPEGKSHSEPHLLELRTGAARMALGAEAEHAFGLGVRVLPVGLIYRAKRRFRSEVAVWVGRPIALDDLRALHGRDERAAVRTLTARIAEGLRAVTLELERWDDLALLEFTDRMLVADERLRWPRVRELARRLRALRASDPERVDALTARVEELRERLGRLGLGVDELDRRYPARTVLRFCLRTLPVVVAGLPLALAGTLVWWLPYRLVGRLTRRLGPSRSVFATVQILAAAVLFPAWLLVGSLLVWRHQGAAWALGCALAAAALGPLAVRFWDGWHRTLADVGSFFLHLFDRGLVRRLAAEREALAHALSALASTRGPLEPPAGARES